MGKALRKVGKAGSPRAGSRFQQRSGTATSRSYPQRKPYGKRGPYKAHKKRPRTRGPYKPHKPKEPRFGEGQTYLLRRDWLRWKKSVAIRKARRKWHVTRSHGITKDWYLQPRRYFGPWYGGMFAHWEGHEPWRYGPEKRSSAWDSMPNLRGPAQPKPEAERYKHAKMVKRWRRPHGLVKQGPDKGESRWRVAYRKHIEGSMAKARRQLAKPGFRIDPDGAWRTWRRREGGP